ncbi:MAG: hypothetical protein ACPLXR_08850 [Halothiobacillaceae bacterium]
MPTSTAVTAEVRGEYVEPVVSQLLGEFEPQFLAQRLDDLALFIG